MSPPRAPLALLAVLALGLPAVMMVGSADHPHVVDCALPASEACPDLTVDADRFRPYVATRTFSASACAVQEGSTEAGTRALLRFNFTTPNIGLGDLVVGSPSGNPAFEWGACHGHYHFKEFADYRLWTPEAFERWHALRLANPDLQAHEVLAAHPDLDPVRGDKRGFCVIDLVQYHPLRPPKWLTCEMQGISSGWADEYSHRLDGQWIDVTGVPSGAYVLEAEVNAERLYRETDYANNRAWRSVTI